jgi:hypothetical protein
MIDQAQKDRIERRRWLLEALAYELGDRLHAADYQALYAGLEAAAHGERAPALDRILVDAGGLSRVEAAQVRTVGGLPAATLTDHDLDTLEWLLVKTTTGYALFATEPGQAELKTALRASAQKTVATLLGRESLMPSQREQLAYLATLPEPSWTPDLVRAVHRMAMGLGT